MLTVLSLLLVSVATSKLADSVIDGNSMTTWMPANKVVYVAIQGSGFVEVEAKGAAISNKITCQSPNQGMYCLLWTPEQNAFGLANSGLENNVELKLAGFSNQGDNLNYKVVSDEKLILERASSTLIQLNGIKEVNGGVHNLFGQYSGKHLSFTSLNPTKVDYTNRLTLQLLDKSSKLSTDASGRSTFLPIAPSSSSSINFKFSSEKGTPVLLSVLPTAPVSHLSMGRPLGFTSMHLAVAPVTETSTDPIKDELADDCDTEWLEGGSGLMVLDDEIVLGKGIGRGHFGVVHEIHDKRAGVDAVAKLLKKSRKMKSINGASEINNEVSVLNRLPVHENICRFYRAFETREYIVIVLENCGFRSLFQRYYNRRAIESEVRFFLRQMVAGQLALYRASVFQNDVKLTNMMVTESGVLKLIDFGLATFNDSPLYGRMGADGYHCPEMILRKPFHPSMLYTWNDGIIIYKMLYGNYCFGMLTDFATYSENLRTLKYTFPSTPHITPGLRNLFFHLFQFEENRYTIEQLAQDPWLTEGHL